MPIYKVPPRANPPPNFPYLQPKKALPQTKPPRASPLPPAPAIDESVCASTSPTFPPPPDFSPKQQRTTPQGMPGSTKPATSYNMQPSSRDIKFQSKRSFQIPSPPYESPGEEKSFQRWPASPQYETAVLKPPARRHSVASTKPIRESNVYEDVDEPGFSTSQPPDFSNTRNSFAKQGPMDPYVGSLNVVGLIRETFKMFIRDVDAAFVLFYDPCDQTCAWAKRNLKKAAEITKRPNHVYAAVDCTKECELCQKQHVTTLPTMKLFARGITVNTFGENTFLNAQDMKQFVENSPAVNTRPTRRQTCRVQ